MSAAPHHQPTTRTLTPTPPTLLTTSHEGGPPRWHAPRVTEERAEEARFMLHAGLDLSRKRLDVCLLSEHGEFGRGVRRAAGCATVCAAWRAGSMDPASRCARSIESMTGARFVHDTLEQCGWDVQIADAQKVKGLAPLACKTDKIDAWVLAELPSATWCRRSGCPTRRCVRSASGPAFGCTWSSTARCSSTASTRR